MKFWLGNQLEAEYDLDPETVAERFWASKQGRLQLNPAFALNLERSLRGYMTDTAGLNSTWQDESETTGFGAVFAKVRETWPKTRYAKVAGTAFGNVAAYLPSNYWIMAEQDGDGQRTVYIQGIDRLGWTLDDYVIPRLASGLIYAEEITEQEAAVSL